MYNNVDWVKKKSLPENTMYFCAQYRQEYPAENGKDYLVLDAEGKGYYVGPVYAVRTRSPSWFGEGDEKIYVDGETFPSHIGTGTEDYYGYAWGDWNFFEADHALQDLLALYLAPDLLEHLTPHLAELGRRVALTSPLGLIGEQRIVH